MKQEKVLGEGRVCAALNRFCQWKESEALNIGWHDRICSMIDVSSCWAVLGCVAI